VPFSELLRAGFALLLVFEFERAGALVAGAAGKPAERLACVPQRGSDGSDVVVVDCEGSAG